MPDTIDVSIPVEPAAAAALANRQTRQAMGQLISRFLRDDAGPIRLIDALAASRAAARKEGITDADIDAELAAYNAERRSG